MTTPAKTTTYKPATSFQDSEMVCVLHGFGRIAPNISHTIDEVQFMGGRAVNVPWSVAKFWVSNTRADGKIPQGRVYVQVLPNDATTADCLEAVGMSSADMEASIRQFAQFSPQDLVAALGIQKARDLSESLDKYLGNRR